MYVCMYVSVYVCTYVCMYVCVYVRMYVCMYVCMSVCMHVRMHACMYVCMHACIVRQRHPKARADLAVSDTPMHSGTQTPLRYRGGQRDPYRGGQRGPYREGDRETHTEGDREAPDLAVGRPADVADGARWCQPKKQNIAVSEYTLPFITPPNPGTGPYSTRISCLNPKPF